MKASEVIVLIGRSGVGKSVVGSALAQKLGYKWIDSDIYLHDVLKFPSKENYSEEEFDRKKEIELEILKFVLSKNKVVFSSGEGLILNQNEERLSKIKDLLYRGRVILLYREKLEISDFKGCFLESICVKEKSIEVIVTELEK